MVVEHLLSAVDIEEKPSSAFLLAFLLSTLGILVSLLFFSEYASMTMLFFVALGAFPIVSALFRKEEEMEEGAGSLEQLVVRNISVLKVFLYFFLGLLASYFVWFMFFGAKSSVIFAEQIAFLDIAPALLSSSQTLAVIVLNNILVLSIFFFISLLYGAGSILVLSWNASIFAALLAITARQLSSGLQASLVSFAYMLHGIPEFFAYFLAANAGAVLSISLMKKRHEDVGLERVVTDAFLLVFGAYAVVVVAGIIEVFVSGPLLAGLA